MEKIISKQEFDELMRIKGEIRGAGIKEIGEFILKEEGEEGLKKLEDVITNLGYPMKLRKIKMMSFYPVGLDALTMIAAKRIFDWDDKKFQEMGRFNAKFSILMRILMKYFVSIDRFTKGSPKAWRMYFTGGDVKVMEYDENKKYIVLRIENFRLIPIWCQVMIGYLASLLQMIVKTPVTCEETKCVHLGDEYYEFLLKWQ